VRAPVRDEDQRASGDTAAPRRGGRDVPDLGIEALSVDADQRAESEEAIARGVDDGKARARFILPTLDVSSEPHDGIIRTERLLDVSVKDNVTVLPKALHVLEEGVRQWIQSNEFVRERRCWASEVHFKDLPNVELRPWAEHRRASAATALTRRIARRARSADGECRSP
jgi:hypothetical protein